MDPNWNDNQPIYRQLRDRVVSMILESTLKEDDPLPSVRHVAAEYKLNPLTVLKGYQVLVDEGLVAKRRGLGMFVLPGARKKLLAAERERFLREEWPRILERIEQLDLDIQTLLMSRDGRFAGNRSHDSGTSALPGGRAGAPGGSAPVKQSGKKTGDKQ